MSSHGIALYRCGACEGGAGVMVRIAVLFQARDHIRVVVCLASYKHQRALTGQILLCQLFLSSKKGNNCAISLCNKIFLSQKVRTLGVIMVKFRSSCQKTHFLMRICIDLTEVCWWRTLTVDLHKALLCLMDCPGFFK
jgi:hypothetical protein